MRRVLQLVAAAALLSSGTAQAWWNGDWGSRTKLTLEAGPAGADLKASVSQVPVLVRLHTGNFDFSKAKPDGSDLRFVAADDKTPLKHSVEKWDAATELALAWVLVPTLAPGAQNSAIWLYSGNPKAPSIDDAKGVLDPQHLAVFHFAENAGAARDSTGFGNNASKGPPQRNPASLIGGGAVFDGKEALVVPASPSIKFGAAGGLTFSAWVRPSAAEGTLFALRDGAKSIVVALAGGALTASASGGKSPIKASGGQVLPETWSHVAVTAGKKLVLYVNGNEVGTADGDLPDMQGEVTLGEGFAGEMDEGAISSVARSGDWIRVAAKGQGPDAALVASAEGEEGGGGGSSYIGILLNSVTIDGWAVIGILIAMFLVSAWVMVVKTLYVNRNERENHAFLDAFRKSHDRMLELKPPFAYSSLSQVYRTGAEETSGRINGSAHAAALSPKAIEAIRASIDATRVRESQKLNRFMVLLTIAISGGPFLGLLGTVVGVMITFAAIAATGDVNVAAIAPGIAAALVATVAGLAVAIPALFGYNYIGGRIKNITADMQVFADEFLSRIAESYGA
ncbi:MAG: DUF2341 domain-containing protein [Betaproteobacteria bacterium]|nr:DUF2341 domain-containing protein [Betaproteobacteria bacterium]